MVQEDIAQCSGDGTQFSAAMFFALMMNINGLSHTRKVEQDIRLSRWILASLSFLQPPPK